MRALSPASLAQVSKSIGRKRVEMADLSMETAGDSSLKGGAQVLAGPMMETTARCRQMEMKEERRQSTSGRAATWRLRSCQL